MFLHGQVSKQEFHEAQPDLLCAANQLLQDLKKNKQLGISVENELQSRP